MPAAAYYHRLDAELARAGAIVDPVSYDVSACSDCDGTGIARYVARGCAHEGEPCAPDHPDAERCRSCEGPAEFLVLDELGDVVASEVTWGAALDAVRAGISRRADVRSWLVLTETRDLVRDEEVALARVIATAFFVVAEAPSALWDRAEKAHETAAWKLNGCPRRKAWWSR